jgi:DNA polymerase-4
MRRILYLRIAHFHTAVLALLDPQLRDQPVIVAAGNYQRGAVMDASAPAEAAGVERGMSWRHAQRRCPEAALIHYERAAYAPVVEQLGNVVARYTPWVEQLAGAEDEFFASLGEGSLPEGRNLAQQIQAQIAAELNLEAHLGLATGKITARTARMEQGSTQYPTPIPCLPAGRERRFLQPLPVEHLWDLKPEALRRLRLLGLRTLGQVAALPARMLVQPLGPAARWYRDLARGIDRRRVEPWQPSPAEVAACLVEEDDPDRAILEGYLERLAQRVAGALLRAGRYGRSVSLVVHLPGGFRLFATRHLKEPTHLWLAIFHAARALLEILQARITTSVAALEISVGSLETQGAIQLSIFGDEDRGPALRSAIARLQNRFGERAIASGERLPIS